MTQRNIEGPRGASGAHERGGDLGLALRTMAELERRRIQTETDWKVGAQLKTRKSEAETVQRLTKVEPERQGKPASLWDGRPYWSRVSVEPSLIQSEG